MFTLNVKANVQGTVDYLNRIKNGIGDRAITSSLNKTIAQAQTQMIRGITAEYNIKASDVRDRLQIQRARRNGMQFTATLVGNPAGRAKRALNLIRFVESKVSLAQGRRRAKAGTQGQVFFKVKRSGGLRTIKGAFILNVPGAPVFLRTGPGRGDIKPAYTIGIPQMFQAKKIQVPVQQWINVNFPRIFNSDVRYFFGTVK